jgi:hypothetical protein
MLETICCLPFELGGNLTEDLSPGKASVGDLDPLEVQIRILPFSHKGVERTEIMLAK